MTGEVNMLICGTEATLRPVSADRYLANLENAEKRSRDKINTQTEKRTFFWAGMIADSAYIGEEKMFDSADEAVSSLTMEEIADIGGELFSEISLPDIYYGGEEGREVKGERPEIRNQKNLDLTKKRRQPFAFLKEETAFWGGGSEGNDAAAEAKSIAPRRPYTAYGEGLPPGYVERGFYFYHGGDMREVSDYFEKDSRRYDSVFR